MRIKKTKDEKIFDGQVKPQLLRAPGWFGILREGYMDFVIKFFDNEPFPYVDANGTEWLAGGDPTIRQRFTDEWTIHYHLYVKPLLDANEDKWHGQLMGA